MKTSRVLHRRKTGSPQAPLQGYYLGYNDTIGMDRAAPTIFTTANRYITYTDPI